MKMGRILGVEQGRKKEWLSVKGKSGERGSKTSEKGLESWFRNETRNISFQQRGMNSSNVE